MGEYPPEATNLLQRTEKVHLATPSLCFLATQDRLAPPDVQRLMAARFENGRVIEVPTWHLHSADVLGSAYTAAIQSAVDAWFPLPSTKGKGPEGPRPVR
jgi:hypothetical protein